MTKPVQDENTIIPFLINLLTLYFVTGMSDNGYLVVSCISGSDFKIDGRHKLMVCFTFTIGLIFRLNSIIAIIKIIICREVLLMIFTLAFASNVQKKFIKMNPLLFT